MPMRTPYKTLPIPTTKDKRTYWTRIRWNNTLGVLRDWKLGGAKPGADPMRDPPPHSCTQCATPIEDERYDLNYHEWLPYCSDCMGTVVTIPVKHIKRPGRKTRNHNGIQLIAELRQTQEDS